MAKKGTAKRGFVTRALKNVGIGLVGKVPIAGVVLKALTKAALETAAAHLAEARRLIEETGYHRRDGELAELEALVG